MTLKLTLSPEREARLTQQARRAGLPLDEYALQVLDQAVEPTAPTEQERLHRLMDDLQAQARALPAAKAASPLPDEGSMADYLADFIGSLHSSEIVPGGAHLSQETGRKFAEVMRRKREQGKL